MVQMHLTKNTDRIFKIKARMIDFELSITQSCGKITLILLRYETFCTACPFRDIVAHLSNNLDSSFSRSPDLIKGNI